MPSEEAKEAMKAEKEKKNVEKKQEKEMKKKAKKQEKEMKKEMKQAKKEKEKAMALDREKTKNVINERTGIWREGLEAQPRQLFSRRDTVFEDAPPSGKEAMARYMANRQDELDPLARSPSSRFKKAVPHCPHNLLQIISLAFAGVRMGRVPFFDSVFHEATVTHEHRVTGEDEKHKVRIVVKEHFPEAYAHLRDHIYGVKLPNVKKELHRGIKEKCSDGKSGDYFFYPKAAGPEGAEVVLKSLQDEEMQTFQDITRDYVTYVHSCDGKTLLMPILALLRLEVNVVGWASSFSINLVMLGNCLRSHIPGKVIESKYDIKGHAVRRTVGEEELRVHPGTTRKDGNWDSEISLDSITAEELLVVVDRDIEFLSTVKHIEVSTGILKEREPVGVMDYSLLIGMQSTEGEAFLGEVMSWSGGQTVLLSYDAKVRYYLSFIDIATTFTLRKEVQHQLANVGCASPSAIPPDAYGKRLNDFIMGAVRGHDSNPFQHASSWLSHFSVGPQTTSTGRTCGLLWC